MCVFLIVAAVTVVLLQLRCLASNNCLTTMFLSYACTSTLSILKTIITTFEHEGVFYEIP